MDDKQLIGVEAMASILNVPVSWVYQRTRLGPQAIPHMKLGRHLRFDPGEVVSFFKQQKTIKNNGNQD